MFPGGRQSRIRVFLPIKGAFCPVARLPSAPARWSKSMLILHLVPCVELASRLPFHPWEAVVHSVLRPDRLRFSAKVVTSWREPDSPREIASIEG
jgi:hypothetical protein